MTALGGRGALFVLLYMTAWLLELAEHWRHPFGTAAVLGILVYVAVAGVTLARFLVFLAFTTGYTLLTQFPEVANHVNLALYCNLLLMLVLGRSWLRHGPAASAEDVYEQARPILQISVVLVYAFAGFAKLNLDFFDPAVSCVGSMMNDLARLPRAQRLGVPFGPVLVLGLALVVDRAVVATRSTEPPARSARLALFAAVSLTLGAALFLVSATVPPVGATVVLGMALVVVVWELVCGPLLVVRRLQVPILVLCWAMHGTLALIGFVDFGGIALALLFTFIPGSHVERLHGELRLPGLRAPVRRVHAYIALCLVAGVFSAMRQQLIAGVWFNLAVLVFLWPLLPLGASARSTPWVGVAITGGQTPRWLYLMPLLLVALGLTPYLGLRTTGNFTMFSNLRTEGSTSNHLLLGGNPLKIWGYQDDTVHFMEIDDREAKIGHQYQALEGQRLPIIEFRRLIEKWTKAGKQLAMTFEYRGVRYATNSIIDEPTWRSGARSWDMRLMDFRVIQTEGPNRCRW